MVSYPVGDPSPSWSWVCQGEATPLPPIQRQYERGWMQLHCSKEAVLWQEEIKMGLGAGMFEGERDLSCSFLQGARGCCGSF